MSYMLMSNEQQIAQEWEKYKGYTVRPVESTINYYTNLIEHYAHHSGNLIYGGTPEIRSIFQRLKSHVTIVDQSEQVVRALGRLTYASTPIAKNEIFIEANWLKLQDLPNKFDFIIGDDAINMVAWPHFDTFLSNAHHILNDDGIFICHLLIKPDDALINKSITQIVDEYHAGKIKSPYDLASRLNFICYDQTSHAMGWQQTIQQIGRSTLNQFIPELDFVDTFGKCNSRFYCPLQADFERIAKRYFRIHEIFYPTEHDYCLFEPVYVLVK